MKRRDLLQATVLLPAFAWATREAEARKKRKESKGRGKSKRKGQAPGQWPSGQEKGVQDYIAFSSDDFQAGQAGQGVRPGRKRAG